MGDEQKELVPVEQREVHFYGDELTAVRADDSQIYVSVTQMCSAMGLDAPTQRRRIQNHDVLVEGYKRGWLKTPPSATGRGGGRQQAGLLRVDLIPLWLAGIRLSRVKEEIQPKLKRFQREAAKVLWEAFQEGRLTTEHGLDDILRSESPSAVAYRMAAAIMNLARQQYYLEKRVDDHEQRLEAIETTLGDPDRLITPAQATEISQAVKAIAMKLSKQSRRNEYGGVYGELYRRYEIPSYKQLPAAQFEACMSWLQDWHSDLTGESPF